MDCPVCHNKNISSLFTSCPKCNSNLVALKMLEALEEQYVETAKSQIHHEGIHIQQKKEFEQQIRQKNRRLNVLGFLVFFLGCSLLYFLYIHKKTPKIIEKQVIVESDSLKHYREANAELAKRLRVINGTRNIRELKYVIREGDALYNLGKLFYNDSLTWYQIALDNKIHDVRGLPIGDTLVLKYRE